MVTWCHPGEGRRGTRPEQSGVEGEWTWEVMESEGLELWGHSKGFGFLHVDHVWYICVKYDHIFPPSSLCVPTVPFSQGPRGRDIQSPISRQSNGSTPTPDGYAGFWSLPGFLPPEHIVLTQLGPLPHLPAGQAATPVSLPPLGQGVTQGQLHGESLPGHPDHLPNGTRL